MNEELDVTFLLKRLRVLEHAVKDSLTPAQWQSKWTTFEQIKITEREESLAEVKFSGKDEKVAADGVDFQDDSVSVPFNYPIGDSGIVDNEDIGFVPPPTLVGTNTEHQKKSMPAESHRKIELTKTKKASDVPTLPLGWK